MSAAPRRPLGQHYLVDAELRGRVVAAAGIEPQDEVLEIGAGPGTLTGELARLARRVVAVELDERHVPSLRRAAPGAEILRANILAMDLATLFPEGGEVVVGNIPYYLTGALLRKLLQEAPLPRRLSLVVQREVAERWCGIGGWSLATVAAQTLSEPRIELDLPPEAFSPPPRVHSALVVLETRPAPAVQVEDLDGFFRFVEQVFQFRRKQLGAVLVRVHGDGRADVDASLRALGIEPERRAETLRLREWEALYRRFVPGSS